MTDLCASRFASEFAKRRICALRAAIDLPATLKKKMNYEYGRFLAIDATESKIGRIDCDEYIRNHSGQLVYRLDGDEVYDLKGALLGTLHSGQLEVNGQLIFKLVQE